MYAAIFRFKFSYPAGPHSRVGPSPPFAAASTTGITSSNSVPDHVFLNGVGVGSLNVAGSMDRPKPAAYHFQSFDGSWDLPQLSPTSETGFRSHSSEGYSTSRSNSVSPTVAHFPSSGMYNYVSALALRNLSLSHSSPRDPKIRFRGTASTLFVSVRPLPPHRLIYRSLIAPQISYITPGFYSSCCHYCTAKLSAVELFVTLNTGTLQEHSISRIYFVLSPSSQINLELNAASACLASAVPFP
jgi:hypothetical protein